MPVVGKFSNTKLLKQNYCYREGSINPYFGVYKEPRYKTTIEITPIAKLSWSKAIKYISSKASFVSKLLMNEVPDNIESALLT